MRLIVLMFLFGFTTSVFAAHPCSKPKYNEKCYRKAHDANMKKVNILYNHIMELESATPHYKQRIKLRIHQWIRSAGHECRSTACTADQSEKMVEYLREQRRFFNEPLHINASMKYTLLMDY